jgi:CRISPR type I-E-associated protein CasA/Cse1
MQNFNLIDSPWIPVRWRADATTDTPLISLSDAFTRGTEIADLDCAPHERIAVTRLLVCITHAALGAPNDEEEWDGFGTNLAEAVPAYLMRTDIYPHFNLLGEGPRFLQENVSHKKGIGSTIKNVV